MRSFSFVLGVIAFLFNPAVACSSSDASYEYGAEELRAAVEGEWSLHLTDGSGDTRALRLQLAQSESPTAASAISSNPQPVYRAVPALIRNAHACGTRTLIASADACVDVTEMPLEVIVVSGDTKSEAEPLSGIFRVYSLIFNSGTLDLTIGETSISAEIAPDGSVTEVFSSTGTSASLMRETH